MYRRIEDIVRRTLEACTERGDLPALDLPVRIAIQKPKRPEHGDFATSICLQTSKLAQRNPRDIAKAFLLHLDDPDGVLDAVEVAGPGFLNFRIRDEVWRQAYHEVAEKGAEYGRSSDHAGQRVLVEFVSANPTGPLHVGHGRGAVTGDSVAALLEAVGYDVDREYYVNDVGNQMLTLGRSLLVRYQQACGRDVRFPDDHYQGDYVTGIAGRFRAEYGESLLDHDYEAAPDVFIDFIKDEILAGIRADLERLGIRFDSWFSERTLHESGRIAAAVAALDRAGHIYTDGDGKAWFALSKLVEGEADRVVIRETGVPTYFAADIAYHHEKIQRGYDHLIDVWGADHHGYIPRMNGVMSALGHDPDRLEMLLVQFVNLVEDGRAVGMSSRSGTFVRLTSLMDDVGEDVTRCNFVMRKTDSQFDFDLKQARVRGVENPVYSVQYGHARICTIVSKAAEAGHRVPSRAEVDLSPLTLPEELGLIKRALDYPQVVASAAADRAPHHVFFYLQDLIGRFHAYYTKYKHTERVITDDAATTAARLYLCDCLRIVLANALGLLGVSAPERMYFSE